MEEGNGALLQLLDFKNKLKSIPTVANNLSSLANLICFIVQVDKYNLLLAGPLGTYLLDVEQRQTLSLAFSLSPYLIYLVLFMLAKKILPHLFSGQCR